jgi:RNA polymerase sigma factor (sigma-70 family)
MAVTESIGSPGGPVAVEPHADARASARLVPLATDERLARQVERDDRAFVTIYERHHQTLYRYCRALLRDETDAQDAAQSTWTRALVALRRGKRDAPLMPWLFRIAHNESISQVRRRGRQRPAVESVDPGPLADQHGESASAEEQAIDRERFTQLLDDLHELPDQARGALLMRELGGLSHDEIASSLGTSVGGAKQSILEARRGLQEFAAGRALICDEVTRRVSDGDRRTLRGRQIRAHLRVCEPCSAFAASIDGRRRTLRAFAPTLAAPAAAAGLAHALGAGGASAGGAAATGVSAGAAGAVGLAGAGLAGAGAPSGAVVAVAGKSATLALLSKALTGVAVVVAAGATAHALTGSSAKHHSRRAVADRHSAAGSRPHATAAHGAAPHEEVVAAAHVGGHRSAQAALATTVPTMKARSTLARHRLAAAGSVIGRRVRTGSTSHRMPTSAPEPGRLPRQRTHTPVRPTHVPAQPIRIPAGPTRDPGQGAPAPTQAPVASQQPPGQMHTSPGHIYFAPGQNDAPPGHVDTTPGQSDTPPGQSNFPPGHDSFTPGQGDTAPEPSDTTPGSVQVPPGHIRVVPRQVHTPLGQTETPTDNDPASSSSTTSPVSGPSANGGSTPSQSATTPSPSDHDSSPSTPTTTPAQSDTGAGSGSGSKNFSSSH